MPDGPAPELREPMIPSKGYAQAAPPVGLPPTVADAYGCEVRVDACGPNVVLAIHGHARYLNAAQRKDFQLLFDEAERQAEAWEATDG
jgi:hypothetical protein